MSLGARDRQVLASIEARLIRSDPELAAQFASFNRPAADPGWAGRARRWLMAKRKAAVAVLCLAIAAGVLSALPSSGQAAGSGCGTTALDCTQTEYGCYGVSGVRRPPGAPPICQAEPPSTP